MATPLYVTPVTMSVVLLAVTPTIRSRLAPEQVWENVKLVPELTFPFEPRMYRIFVGVSVENVALLLFVSVAPFAVESVSALLSFQ